MVGKDRSFGEQVLRLLVFIWLPLFVASYTLGGVVGLSLGIGVVYGFIVGLFHLTTARRL